MTWKTRREPAYAYRDDGHRHLRRADVRGVTVRSAPRGRPGDAAGPRGRSRARLHAPDRPRHEDYRPGTWGAAIPAGEHQYARRRRWPAGVSARIARRGSVWADPVQR